MYAHVCRLAGAGGAHVKQRLVVVEQRLEERGVARRVERWNDDRRKLDGLSPTQTHRRLVYKEHTRTQPEGADPRVWGVARTGLRVAWSPAISRIRDYSGSHPVVVLECCQSEVHVLGLEYSRVLVTVYQQIITLKVIFSEFNIVMHNR